MSRYTIEYSRERGPQGASGSTDASAITSGTLNNARLSSQVLLATEQTLTTPQKTQVKVNLSLVDLASTGSASDITSGTLNNARIADLPETKLAHPSELNGAQLWLDAGDPRCSKLRPVMSMDNTTANYITGTGTESFSVTTKFSIELWINQKTVSPDTNFAAHGRYGQSGMGWAICSADDVYGGNSIQFWFASDSSGTAFIQRKTPVLGDRLKGPLSHVLIVYDGTQGTASNRLMIYINGELQTLTGSGTIPASLQTITQPLYVGGWGGLSGSFGHKSLNGGLICFRYWNDAIDVPSGTTAATYLWNGGKPVYLNDLSSTYNASSLLINLEKGAWSCNKTKTLFTQVGSGTISKAFTVDEAYDLSPNKRTYDRHAAGVEPWVSTDTNGKKCWETFAQHYLKSTTPDLFLSTTADTIVCSEQVSFVGTEGFYIGSEQYAGNDSTRYYLTGWLLDNVGTPRPLVRKRNVSSPDGTLQCEAANLITGVPILQHWRALASAVWEYRKNNITQTVTNNSAGSSSGGSDIAGQDHSFVSGFSDGQFDKQKIGVIAVFAPALSSESFASVIAEIASIRGITI